MARYKTLIILLLSTVFWSADLIAEDMDNNIDKARWGLAQSLISLSEYDQAMPLMKGLYEKYPHDDDVVVQYALLLAHQKQYADAIELCRTYLNDHGKDKTVQLWLARFLSWDRQYDKAVEEYTVLTADYPDWQIPAREKARVLGWDRKYDQAIEQYDKAFRLDPNHIEIKYEQAAKYDLYNQLNLSAVDNYKRWLAIEPNNLEALYDLGQIYSRQAQWTHAESMYQQVLEHDGGHFRARQAMNKVELYSRHARVQTGLKFLDAKSVGRTMDQSYWDVYTAFRIPVDPNTFLTLRQDNIWYKFQTHEQVYQQALGINLEYHKNPQLWGSVDYTQNLYPDEKGTRRLFGGNLHYLLSDRWTVHLGHRREQITDNETVFLDKLYRDNYKGRIVYKPYRRLEAGTDCVYSHYSDDNNRNAYGLDLNYSLMLEPKNLKTFYRYEEYRFDHQKADYFSPDSFHYNMIGLEWRRFLNTDELYWGANDTYYTLRYAVTLDVHQQTGHTLYIDLHRDWTDRCSSHVEWSKTRYEHRETYGENRLTFYMTFYF